MRRTQFIIRASLRESHIGSVYAYTVQGCHTPANEKEWYYMPQQMRNSGIIMLISYLYLDPSSSRQQKCTGTMYLCVSESVCMFVCIYVFVCVRERV